MELKNIKTYLDKYFKIDISNKSRKHEYFRARCIYFKLAKSTPEWHSLDNISKVVKRDHATAIHGLKQFDILYNSDKRFKYDFNKIAKGLKETLNDEFNKSISETDETIKIIEAYQNEIINLKEKIEQLKDNKTSFNDSYVHFKPLFELSSSDVSNFIETRLKPFVKMMQTTKKQKQIIEVKGAMLR